MKSINPSVSITSPPGEFNRILNVLMSSPAKLFSNLVFAIISKVSPDCISPSIMITLSLVSIP